MDVSTFITTDQQVWAAYNGGLQRFCNGLDRDAPMRHDSYEKVYRELRRASVAMTEGEKLKSEKLRK